MQSYRTHFDGQPYISQTIYTDSLLPASTYLSSLLPASTYLSSLLPASIYLSSLLPASTYLSSLLPASTYLSPPSCQPPYICLQCSHHTHCLPIYSEGHVILFSISSFSIHRFLSRFQNLLKWPSTTWWLSFVVEQKVVSGQGAWPLLPVVYMPYMDRHMGYWHYDISPNWTNGELTGR